MSYVVTVDWVVERAEREAFKILAADQARNSINEETDCLLFDLCQDEADPNRFFMYEIYVDRAAFDLHLESDHFKQFSADIEGLFLSKTVSTLEKVT